MQILRVQLKHERHVAEFTIFLAIGAAFIVFALSSILTATLLNANIPANMQTIIEEYSIVALACIVIGLIRWLGLESSEKKELDEIRRVFNIKKRL